MKRELIVQIFASLQSLEKQLAESKNRLPYQHNTIIAAALDEQERIVSNMRREANRLQLELAKDRWPQAVRSLKIFYGLHHMVRPEIRAVHSALISNSPFTNTALLYSNDVVH